jgi:hypothetical protein
MIPFFRFVLALSVVPVLAHGQGVSPYLPLDMPPGIARQIERVLILADRPLIRRPIAVTTVEDALPLACARDAELCAQVERYLARYAAPIALTDAQLEVAMSGNAAVPLANRRGLASDDAWIASAAAQWRPTEHLLIGVGAIARPGDVTPTGSVASVGTSYAQLDAGFREHWSSALTDSSFLMSSEAATMPSVTLSNLRPLGRMGISYEVFVARMSRTDHITYQGGFTNGHPLLAGTYFAIEPVRGWSLGISRQLQFGGGARAGSNPGDLFKAFFDPSGHDNTRAGTSTDSEFGNQQAAWTSSFIFPGRKPFVISLEYAGEDTSHSTAGRLGNAALSAGISIPRLWQNVDLTYEISEWQNGWNAHHIYQDGMTNDARVLGHWGADRRLPGDDVGARSQMLRLTQTTRAGGSIDLQFRTLKNAGYSSVAYRRANELSARYSLSLKNTLVGGELLLGRDVLGDNYMRVAASTRFLAGAGARLFGGETSNYAGVDPEAAIFADIGMAFTRVRMDIDSGTLPKITTAAHAAPHLGLGARRAVTGRSDLGARIELDRVDDHTLLAVRALDYRYRLNGRLALTAFAGAARYAVATPAYGYYLGTGVQWREVLPRWDVNLDLRYGDKIARDHLLPQESGLKEPDGFYDVYSVSLSMSHRF